MIYLGVGLVSLCVLMLQLALTRLFSATMYYHFAFLAISLALFGSGASGILAYLLGPRLDRWRNGRGLALLAALFALATVLALVVVLRNPLSPVDPAGRTLARLFYIYASAALAFFFAGAAVTLAVTLRGREMSRLYFFDLAGAAAGCLLLLPVMNALGAVNTVLLVAALAACAAVLFTHLADGSASRALRAGVVLLAAALAAGVAANAATGRLDIREAKGLTEAGHVIFARWNSFSRVTVWGSLDEPSVLIMIDADAASLLTRDATDRVLHAGESRRVEALAYHLRPNARTLIIGPGGGDDVMRARLFGAGPISAVEVNPIIARDVVSSEPFRSYSGALFEQPGVHLVVDEARSFIRRSREHYDVIQGTMVDTWAATAAGAFALTENNLYTVEAFQDYLFRMGPHGVLSFTRWYLEPPDQLLRLVSLARVSLAGLGRRDAARRVMVVRGVPEAGGAARAAATFLLKREAFTDLEVAKVEEVARENGFELVYTPRTRPPNAVTRLLEAKDPAEFWRSFPSDVTPPRDDRPFFFHTVRLGRLGDVLGGGREVHKTNLGTFVLFGLLAMTTVMAALFMVGPLALRRAPERVGAAVSRLGTIGYFAALGAGFITVEVALVQKCILFLGHPVYALAVVLFSLLVFSGLGSALTGRVPDERVPAALPRVLLAVAALVVLAVLGMSPVFYALVHLARGWRIAVTVALLAPLGIAMGMPMPLGIRALVGRAPDLVPWAWGVNGAASVAGSVAALAIAMLSGFNAALLTAAALYLVALAPARRWAPARA